jgi:hypothetical protein
MRQALLLLVIVTACGSPKMASTDPSSTIDGSIDPTDATAADAPAIDAVDAAPIVTGKPKYDAYDSMILSSVATEAWPDAMMIKAMVYQESSFEWDAISDDSPCGRPSGWTDAESKSFGLMQITPACDEGEECWKADGHPNRAKDMSSPDFATSCYRPELNIAIGTATTVSEWKSMQNEFASCTPNEYILMAIAAYNSGHGSVDGCTKFSARAQLYIDNVLERYDELARLAGVSNPY